MLICPILYQVLALRGRSVYYNAVGSTISAQLMERSLDSMCNSMFLVFGMVHCMYLTQVNDIYHTVQDSDNPSDYSVSKLFVGVSELHNIIIMHMFTQCCN